ncbi:Asparagine-tRNA ligase protein [Raphanus sativus]|nr:Asparagine-tRNA ligase protein [Raphanus sativus]
MRLRPCATEVQDQSLARLFREKKYELGLRLLVDGETTGRLRDAIIERDEIYTFGPTFRAENSNTSRHLAEFWVSEASHARRRGKRLVKEIGDIKEKGCLSNGCNQLGAKGCVMYAERGSGQAWMQRFLRFQHWMIRF